MVGYHQAMTQVGLAITFLTTTILVIGFLRHRQRRLAFYGLAGLVGLLSGKYLFSPAFSRWRFMPLRSRGLATGSCSRNARRAGHPRAIGGYVHRIVAYATIALAVVHAVCRFEAPLPRQEYGHDAHVVGTATK